jgi:hypothetical protein
LRRLRRSLLRIGGAMTLLAAVAAGAAGVLAHEESHGDQPAQMEQNETLDNAPDEATRQEIRRMPVQWSATSPATHLGDQYRLLVTNAGAEAQVIWVSALIMDHSAHTNIFKIVERVELAPGEEHVFTAVNDYGTANHFKTNVASETEDLTLVVTLTDASGEETTRFNEKAFWVRSGALLAAGARFRPNAGELAAFLGTMTDELRSDLASGLSLAEIAEDHDISRDELKQFLTDQFETWLDDLTANGQITSDQEEQAREWFAANLDRLIDRTRHPRQHEHDQPNGVEATPAA